jgi:hypothetical protein
MRRCPGYDSVVRGAGTHPGHGALARSDQLSRSCKRRQRGERQRALIAFDNHSGLDYVEPAGVPKVSPNR